MLEVSRLVPFRGSSELRSFWGGSSDLCWFTRVSSHCENSVGWTVRIYSFSRICYTSVKSIFQRYIVLELKTITWEKYPDIHYSYCHKMLLKPAPFLLKFTGGLISRNVFKKWSIKKCWNVSILDPFIVNKGVWQKAKCYWISQDKFNMIVLRRNRNCMGLLKKKVFVFNCGGD